MNARQVIVKIISGSVIRQGTVLAGYNKGGITDKETLRARTGDVDVNSINDKYADKFQEFDNYPN